MLTEITSTLNDGAIAWMTPNMASPVGLVGIPKDSSSRHARRDLLEEFQPFAAQAVFEIMKPVALPPGRARLSTKPAPTGSAATGNTIGTVWWLPTAPRSCAIGKDNVGRERD